jgi:hypothetical protein
MRRCRAGAGVTVAVLMAVAAAYAAPRSVSLELKGEPGQELRYGTTFECAMQLEARDPGTGREVLSIAPRVTGRMTTIQRVHEVAENGDLTLGGQIESFGFTLDVADLHAQLAIEGPDGGAPELIKLPPLPVRAVMSKRGKTLDIEGLDRLPIPPLPGPSGKPIDIGAMIKAFVQQYSQPLFPDRPVSVGETWEWETAVSTGEMLETLGMPMPEEMKERMSSLSIPLKSTSTLVGFEEVGGVECAKVEAAAPWRLSMPLSGGEESGAPMLEESGVTTVVTWFDHAAGRTVRETATIELTMRVGGEQAALAEMRMVATGETNLK